MLTDPVPPPPDDKDWTWVLQRPCADCGFDATSLDRAELPDVIRGAVDDFRSAVRSRGASDRSVPDVWSALEYGCHVRDVCGVFDGRLSLMLDEANPMFANWDQDQTALEERYWTQTPAVVADELHVAGFAMAQRFADLHGDQWQRPGRRSDGSVFTVETLGKYFTHDLVHHVHDISSN